MAGHVIAAKLSTAPTSAGLYRPLLLLATALALCVVGLGAYVRLTDAGLGCPDWPGCYGHVLVPDHAADIGRAWHEMIHRYAAGSLGLLILGLTVAAWRRSLTRSASPWLVTGLCGLVVLQALMGMWTVTALLKPVIVTAHLLGGLLVWTLLVVLCRREFGAAEIGGRGRLGGFALATVLIQAALGGWVSSNYAGLACPDFPFCSAGGWPATAAAAIQWVHRLGALAVLSIAGGYAIVLMRVPAHRLLGLSIAAALAIQVALGVGNVLLRLPLPLAVAHTLGAALLLASIAVALSGRRA